VPSVPSVPSVRTHLFILYKSCQSKDWRSQCALRALRAKLFCILENAWERRTLVRHVFYVFIFLCALRVLRANPSFIFHKLCQSKDWRSQRALRALCALCAFCAKPFFLFLACPLCSLCEPVFALFGVSIKDSRVYFRPFL